MTIFTVTDSDQTISDKIMAITGITGWHHAVEHIDATANRFYDIFWFTYAHQITWFILWHFVW